MTIYNRPDDVPAWAEAGDRVQPADAEIQEGWPLSPVPPSRQRFNWILNFVANAVRYFTQRGVSEWDTDEDYPQFGRVQHTGVTWVALLANSGVEPGTDAATWERWGYSETELAAFNDAYLTKSVAGGANVVLTASEAKKAIFNFTGLLTANINVTIPGAAKRFVVRNNTTGAFTLTVKTAAGAGISVLQGSVASLFCDGVVTDYAPKTGDTVAQFDNTVKLATTAFVQRAGGNFAGQVSIAAPNNILASYAGFRIVCTAAGNLTLPAYAGLLVGSKFYVQNSSAGVVNIVRAGADTISALGTTGLTTIAIPIGGVAVIAVGGASYVLEEGPASLRYASEFAAALALNGYQKLPGGLIIQWGVSAAIAAGSSGTVTFPIAFNNAILSASATPGVTVNTTTGNAGGVQFGSTSSMTIRNIGTTTSYTYQWIAIGY